MENNQEQITIDLHTLAGTFHMTRTIFISNSEITVIILWNIQYTAESHIERHCKPNKTNKFKNQ